jgi:hypothetical protein
MWSPTSTLFSHDEKPLLHSPSIFSSSTTLANSSNALSPFSTKTLHISTLGTPLLGRLFTYSALTTAVLAEDNTIAFLSTREKNTSGTCTLSSPDSGDLITTTYRFGPGKPPVLRYVDTPDHEITLRGRWLARSQRFLTPTGHELEWRYTRETDPETGKKANLIILVDVVSNRRVAQLVRSEGSRTEGSGISSAGNGGCLMIDEEACGKVVDEAMVVATCLVMLKKEVDRRRCVRAVVLSAAISAGGSC